LTAFFLVERTYRYRKKPYFVDILLREKSFVNLVYTQEMGLTKLEKFDRRKLLEEAADFKDLGSGSSGSAKLLFSKDLKEYVVGKFFQCSGLQSKIKKQIKEAEREAEIIAQFKHENIVRVLGVSLWAKDIVVIILEFAPCGDLENLLMLEKDISLPWKLRARFFTELANALDYLHNHDPKRSFIHGDLKPQNVFLGEKLEIKLGDFGSTTIAQITGATSLAITGEENTQHTPLYAAPEFLNSPTDRKSKKMDVYSFGMIGYEILTRQVVYEGAPIAVVLPLIKSTGQKPDIKCLHDVAGSLEQNRNNLEIFAELDKIVESCWQTIPDARPDAIDVKKRLDVLAHSKKIYDKITNSDVNKVIKKRKLKPQFLSSNRQNNSKAGSPSYPWLKLWIAESLWLKWFLLLLAGVLVVCAAMLLAPDQTENVSGLNFLIVEKSELFKYEVENKKIKYLGSCVDDSNHNRLVEEIVKVNDQVYIFRLIDPIVLLSLGSSELISTTFRWKEKYLNRKYISVGSNLFAIGGIQRKEDSTSTLDNKFFPTAAADVYNTVTKTWTELPDMNEPRVGHTLVLFQGLICAIGGDKQVTLECFNTITSKWSYLPTMIITLISRMKAGAVELNGELYVIGGDLKYTDGDREGILPMRSVEKYSPVSFKWTKVASLNSPRSGVTAGVLNGKIYITGGSHNPSVVETYDPSKNIWEQDNVLDFSTFALYTVF